MSYLFATTILQQQFHRRKNSFTAFQNLKIPIQAHSNLSQAREEEEGEHPEKHPSHKVFGLKTYCKGHCSKQLK